MGSGRGEVDGVPVFWADLDGPLRAGLTFRVGRVDETLARGGLTHLLEHLVLHPVAQPLHSHQGQVEPVLTTFATEGDASSVCRFLEAVCRSLASLPFDRLDLERNVLAAEAGTRQRWVAEPLLPWRYGAATFGLPAFEEFGLNELTPADLQAWAARWFTRDNAALWVLGGPPPAGLRLDLPAGSRRPVPTPSSALPKVPAYFTSGTTGIALSTVVPRSSAAVVYTQILQGELHRVLRLERAISYSPWVAYEPRDAEFGYLVAYADGVPDHHSELTARFQHVLEQLAASPPTDELYEQALTASRDMLNRPEAGAGLAHASAVNLLLGARIRSREELLAELDSCRPQDIRDAANLALTQALFMLPERASLTGSRWQYVPAPVYSSEVVSGRRVNAKGWHEQRVWLMAGEDGISLTDGDRAITVRYDACAVMLAWPDGGRSLIGEDGFHLSVEPTLWRSGEDLVAELDQRMPARLVAARRARDPSAVPQPNRLGARRLKWRMQRLRKAVVLGVPLIAIVVFFMYLIVAAIIEGHPAIAIGVAIGGLIGLALGGRDRSEGAWPARRDDYQR